MAQRRQGSQPLAVVGEECTLGTVRREEVEKNHERSSQTVACLSLREYSVGTHEMCCCAAGHCAPLGKGQARSNDRSP
jgi:hypothetical protein